MPTTATADDQYQNLSFAAPRPPLACLLRTVDVVEAVGNEMLAGDVAITGRTSSLGSARPSSGIQMPRNQNPQLLKSGLKIGCTDNCRCS